MGQINSLDDVLNVLRRRLVLIVGISLIGAALSILYATSLPRIYETTAVIQIELSGLAENAAGQSPGARAKHRLNLITQQLMARGSLAAVIEELELFADTGLSDSERIDALRKAVRIEQILDAAEAWRPDAVPSGLSIRVRLDDPAQAALVANTFLERILAQNQARRRAQASQALDFFEGEAARVGEKIAALEAEIARFKQQNAASLPAGIAILRGQLASLSETELEIEREIIRLRTNGSRLREDVLNRQIAELQEQRDLVTRRIGAVETAIAAAPEVERALSGLSRELEQLQQQLGVITRRRAEAEMEAMLESSQVSERFEVLETALVPEYPVSPSRRKITAAGTLAFLALGLGLALLLEMLKPAIRTASQLEAELGVVPVVTIPDLGRRGHRRRPGAGHGRGGGLGWLLAAIAVLATGIWLALRRRLRPEQSAASIRARRAAISRRLQALREAAARNRQPPPKVPAALAVPVSSPVRLRRPRELARVRARPARAPAIGAP